MESLKNSPSISFKSLTDVKDPPSTKVGKSRVHYFFNTFLNMFIVRQFLMYSKKIHLHVLKRKSQE